MSKYGAGLLLMATQMTDDVGVCLVNVPFLVAFSFDASGNREAGMGAAEG